jgi:26S proteasome regulatory subunit N6
MILDHRFSGILDQGRGHLVIFDHSTDDVSFSKGLEVVENMNKVVEVLVGRAQRLNKAT